MLLLEGRINEVCRIISVLVHARATNEEETGVSNCISSYIPSYCF